jgi:tetratricopeptide (TPR) repeat protein
VSRNLMFALVAIVTCHLDGNAVVAQPRPATAKAPAVGDVIYLTVTEPGTLPSQTVPLLLRELVRQAFLLTARDELGLATRDVMLREDFPKNPDEKSIPFELSCLPTGSTKTTNVEYALSRGGPDADNIWSHNIRVDVDSSQSIATVAQDAEALSRGELKKALFSAGGKGNVPAARASAELPGAVSDLLWNWNEVSVLAGLRRVHGEIREKGESPQLLAALAVGYANLGTLTEYYYGGAHKVYYARGLLYAERLLRKNNESAWALWHRAYVRMQLGLHNLGAEDIAAAKQKQAAFPAALPLPFWTEVIDAFSQGQCSRMLKIAKTPPQRRLARYLNLQAVAYGSLRDLSIQAMHDFLKDCPDSPRAYDMLASSGEIGTLREGSDFGLVVGSELLRKRLPDIPGLPERISKQLASVSPTPTGPEEMEFRQSIMADLEKSGSPERDRGEPSLSAVGHSIEEMHFAEVIRKLEVDRNSLSVPTEETIALLKPLVANHPYAAYADAFSRDKRTIESATEALSGKVTKYDLGLKEVPLVNWLYSVTKRPEHSNLWRIAGGHADMVLSDEMQLAATGILGNEDNAVNKLYMPKVWNTSNRLPVTVALRIARDWPHAEAEAREYERQYADEPLVLHELRERYFKLQRYDDAERCAKRQIEVAPGYPAYRALAAIYKVKKDSARWRQTLDQALVLPSYGLEQAQVQNEIALDLLKRKQFQEAVTYADAAAESYARWAMLTAARCHEMLGEWKKSEQWIRAASERYESEPLEWLKWCRRTGHGDVRAAAELAHSKFEALGTSLYRTQYRNIGHYYLLTDEGAKAFLLYQRAYEDGHDPFEGFHAAIIADTLGNTAARDQLLQKLSAVKSRRPRILHFKQLAEQLRKMLPPQQAKHLDVAEVDKIIAAMSLSTSVDPSVLPYFVGAFLKNRGNLETAKTYLIRCAQSDDWRQINHALACRILREMKVEVPAAGNLPRDADSQKAPTE